MAYSGKLSSIRQVVESAYMDAGIDDINYPFAVETCVNLMGLIGVPDLYIEKTTNNTDQPAIVVSDYRAKLPDDMVELVDMRKILLDSEGRVNSFSEMIESSDVYHSTQNYTDSGGSVSFSPVGNHPLMELDEYDELSVEDGIVVGENSYRITNAVYTYKIQGNYIFTNFKDGYIDVVYRGYPLDEEGFPMIPDDEKFKSALKYEIIFKLDYKTWRANPASPGLKALVNDSEQRRDWYVGAAKTKGRIPTIGQMESLKNQWLRTIPKLKSHADGFKSNNIQETRYNQWKNRRI